MSPFFEEIHTLDYLGYWDEDEVNTSYKDITFFVHKGSKAAKAVQAEGYKLSLIHIFCRLIL